MLKVTMIRDNGLERELKLEGKLLADWVGELLDAYDSARVGSVRLILNLSELSFADAAGAAALQELLRQGACLSGTSPLVGELLKRN